MQWRDRIWLMQWHDAAWTFAVWMLAWWAGAGTHQYLINSDGQDSGNYGPGYDVVITCADGICVVEGVNGNGDAGWQLVKAQIQVIVNREVVSTEWFVGRLPICDVCDVDGDGKVTLRDFAVCWPRFEEVD